MNLPTQADRPLIVIIITCVPAGTDFGGVRLSVSPFFHAKNEKCAKLQLIYYNSYVSVQTQHSKQKFTAAIC